MSNLKFSKHSYAILVSKKSNKTKEDIYSDKISKENKWNLPIKRLNNIKLKSQIQVYFSLI
jgi:hypothetical protein